MRKNERENTIIVWSRQKEIVKYVVEYGKYHNLNICFPSNVTEVLDTANFLFFIDADNFNVFLKTISFRLSDYFKEHKNRIVLYTNQKNFHIADEHIHLVEKVPDEFTRKDISELISKGQDRLETEKKIRNLEFNNKVFRIIFLYKMLEHGETIKTKEICERFKISERTLRRDIKILKDVDLERPIYFDPEEGYHV